MKVDRGRYFYQRRVPRHLQDTLGFTFWQRRCGDVAYSKAVQLIVTWSEEDDDLIQELRDPKKRELEDNKRVRRANETHKTEITEIGLPRFLEMTEQRAGEKQYYPITSLPRPWQAAAMILAEAEANRRGEPSIEGLVGLIEMNMRWVERGEAPDRVIVVPNYKPILDYLESRVDLDMQAKLNIRIGSPVKKLSDLNYLDFLNDAYAVGFGDDAETPTDADDRDEYEFLKRKLERKISELLPTPHTISRVAEKYYTFNSVRPATRSKYRRNLAKLIEITGDVPIKHVRTTELRQLRDKMLMTMKPASLQAVFTPIKGVFSHALEEDIIEHNPMSGVKLPRDKRPIEQRKWKKFEPEEIRRILDAAETFWGNPLQGLTKERRQAIHMVIRVLAYSGMRPVEVIRLTPDDVNATLIRIKDSKTESSTRVIPLHPEISDFPDWLRAGGMTTFSSIKTDQVGSVRHNFARLIRELMPNPILDPQKTLYSFRSTFVNAMRRAGADIQIQRAILGHKEAGAIRHYDDGPEFEIKRRWVEMTDPRYHTAVGAEVEGRN